jgi:hypothetical protein
MYLILFLLLFLAPQAVAGATIYYVSTSGSDSNPGTQALPFRNPQRCINNGATKVMVAGDTCILKAGTYTIPAAPISSGRTVYITSAVANSGTASQPITIKSETPLAATIVVRTGLDQAQAGILFSGVSWWVVENINFIDDGGTTQSANGATAGIYLEASSDITIRGNSIHHIARNICSNGLFGNAGIQTNPGVIRLMIDSNTFYSIGRKLNGELGCTTTEQGTHDQGIYAIGTDDLTIIRNLFYDIGRGSALNIKNYNAPNFTRRLKILNNTFGGGVDRGGADNGATQGQISLIDNFDDVQIKNNIFFKPSDGRPITWWHNPVISPTSPGVVIQYNLSDTTFTNQDMSRPQLKPSTGITSSNNAFSAQGQPVPPGQ